MFNGRISWKTWGWVNDRFSAFKQMQSCFAWMSVRQLYFPRASVKTSHLFCLQFKAHDWLFKSSPCEVDTAQPWVWRAIGEERLLFTGPTAAAFIDHHTDELDESLSGFSKEKNPSCEVYCVSAAIYRGLFHVTKPVIKLGQRHRRYWQTLSQWTLGVYPGRFKWICLISSGIWFNRYFYCSFT